MDDLVTILTRSAKECLERDREKLWLAVKWRAKFEGWLKIELADLLRLHGYDPRLELTYWQEGRNVKRADISFNAPGGTFHVLLKTTNTNWRMKHVENLGRPITRNYQAILDDNDNLRTLLSSARGVVLAVLFPTGATNVKELESKIVRSAIGAQLLREKPEIGFVDLLHEVRAAVLTFGPY
jgi:hypothetical protein